MIKRLFVSLIGLSFFCLAPYALGYDEKITALENNLSELKTQFETMRAAYENKIGQLEEEVNKLKNENSQAKSVKTEQAVPRPAGRPAEKKDVAKFVQSFNPEISVIGDFIYHGTDRKAESFRNQFRMRQAELAFSASVDPYAKGDFFFHVEPNDEDEWHIGLCEGYITLLTLPINDLQMKAGKFKADFGKVNKLHLHALPWSDYPNVMVNFFGEEGMSQPGIAASYLIPNPWDQYIELTAEVMNNRNSASFAGSSGKDLIYVAHLKNFFDINDESTFEAGGSFATGPNTESHGRYGKNITTMEGIDLTYKWKPLKQGLYRSLVFQNEAYFSQKDRQYLDDGTNIVDGKCIQSWGAYSSLVYQFAKRWSAFGRYDIAEFPDYATRRDNAYSLGLTFAQSEYCYWRVHYKRTERNYDPDSNEVWLQCNFGLGPHRKHEY